ncbi:M20 family metallopeptidase [Desmospora activa]|uniref:Amidohydrolase n=1 Tax=Desmospora activa DSM 45169 TaxID=1121389 RepID=A0A2T4ZAW9_9BACL|nr:M20 family metallopeptidase [Desmospora activa]PTM59051.1 amidohydrolase [Desmospora activa DSM 45169]
MKNSETILNAAIREEVIQWRRFLHQNPELSFEEENTSQFVFDTLQSIDGLVLERPTKTSVVARLIGTQPGKVLAMRADMDALPIQEENRCEYTSKKAGVMHACGHDAHTAMLLGAAKILSQWKDQLKGEIRFIFQHAEELHPGGAQEMVKAGVIDGVDQIIGIHLMSTIPIGQISVRTGPVTANSDRFDITIQGKGGHASQPEESIDPIAIASQVIGNLQHIVSRNVNPLEQLVITITQFHGGSAYNIIPDTVELAGTVRSFQPEVRQQATTLIDQIVKGVTAAHGASYQFDYRRGYSSVVNNPEVAKLMEETVVKTFGEEWLADLPPAMGGEDFSAFAEKVPACFVFVGAGNEEKGIIYPHHHPRFDIDEDALEHGVKLFVQAAINLST